MIYELDGQQYFAEISSETGMFHGFAINKELHTEQTAFQKITIYDTVEFGHLMTIDDLVMLTTRDNFLYHEMMTHPALFTHSNPKNVVIIGGGDCGSLREVLKHENIESVTQVDIDERVTRLSEEYFPELCESNNDPRAHLYFEDGIKWVAKAETDSVDVIIVDSTDPVGPAKGLFNRDFYKACRRVLGEQGLLVQQSESPLLHVELLQSMRQAMHEAGFSSLQTLSFPQPCYPSGWWSATIANAKSIMPILRHTAIERKPFETRYYNVDIHDGAIALPTFLAEALS